MHPRALGDYPALRLSQPVAGMTIINSVLNINFSMH